MDRKNDSWLDFTLMAFATLAATAIVLIVFALIFGCSDGGGPEPQPDHTACDIDEQCESGICQPTIGLCSSFCITHADCDAAQFEVCALDESGLASCVQNCYGRPNLCPADTHECILISPYPPWGVCWPKE